MCKKQKCFTSHVNECIFAIKDFNQKMRYWLCRRPFGCHLLLSKTGLIVVLLTHSPFSFIWYNGFSLHSEKGEKKPVCNRFYDKVEYSILALSKLINSCEFTNNSIQKSIKATCMCYEIFHQ